MINSHVRARSLDRVLYPDLLGEQLVLRKAPPCALCGLGPLARHPKQQRAFVCAAVGREVVLVAAVAGAGTATAAIVAAVAAAAAAAEAVVIAVGVASAAGAVAVAVGVEVGVGVVVVVIVVVVVAVAVAVASEVVVAVAAGAKEGPVDIGGNALTMQHTMSAKELSAATHRLEARTKVGTSGS